MHETYRKEQDEKAAKEAQERDHRRQRMERANARRAWLADGGSEADFEKAWPSLRDEGRRRRVMDADRRAREAMRKAQRAESRKGRAMAARTIIEAERRENLEVLEETFAVLEGVTNEHLTALRRSSTTTALRSFYPLADDPLGQAAYTAAALRGLAETVATLQETSPRSSRATK